MHERPQTQWQFSVLQHWHRQEHLHKSIHGAAPPIVKWKVERMGREIQEAFRRTDRSCTQ